MLLGAGILASLLTLPVAEAAGLQAKLEVTGPFSSIWALDYSAENYTVVVADDVDIRFSANLTSVTNGGPSTANYTWRWNDSSPDSFGIWTTHRFSGASIRLVNLTVLEAGTGNLSWADVRIIVDATNPTAVATATPAGTLNEDIGITFSLSGSYDDTGVPGVPGRIGYWRWDFDSDGVWDAAGRNVTHTFTSPGRYTTTAWVVDWFGRRSLNTTLDFVVTDTTPPSIPRWDVVREGDWEPALGGLDEDSVYWFDASAAVTDNHDGLQDLTFSWSFETVSGGNETRTGSNVSYSWSEPGMGYSVRLDVVDSAGNPSSRRRDQVVQVNLAQHANVQVQDVKADPTTVEDGATTTITVRVKHVGGNIAATNVRLIVKALRGPATTDEAVTVNWFDADGITATNADIAKDQTKVAKFTYNVGGTIGNVRIEVRAESDAEPKTWIEEAGKSVTITVKEAGWRGLAIGVFFAILLLGVGLGLAALLLAQSKRPPRAGGEPPAETTTDGITSHPEPERPEPPGRSPGPPS